jgi:hypothetical protein
MSKTLWHDEAYQSFDYSSSVYIIEKSAAGWKLIVSVIRPCPNCGCVIARNKLVLRTCKTRTAAKAVAEAIRRAGCD